MVKCRISIRSTATSQQLKELSETLERWCNDEIDTGACCCRVNDQHLADLQVGELPQPEFLNLTTMIHRGNEVRELLGIDPVELEPYQREQLKQEMGDEARRRDVVVYIEYSPEFHGDAGDAIESLKSAVADDVVANIEVNNVPDDDEELDSE